MAVKSPIRRLHLEIEQTIVGIEGVIRRLLNSETRLRKSGNNQEASEIRQTLKELQSILED